MPVVIPTLERAPAVHEAAGARLFHVCIHCDDAAFQCDGGRSQLIGGCRRIRALCCLVVERAAFVGLQTRVVLAGYTTNELVDVVRWCAVQREHFSRSGFQRHHRASQRIAKVFVRESLQIHVDVCHHRRRRLGRDIGPHARLAHDAITRVHLNITHAFRAPQASLVL